MEEIGVIIVAQHVPIEENCLTMIKYTFVGYQIKISCVTNQIKLYLFKTIKLLMDESFCVFFPILMRMEEYHRIIEC